MLIPEPYINSGYDAVAHQYQQGRPEYPPEAIRELLAGISYAPEKSICDVGAGTGKLTKAILDVYPTAHIVAIEPSQEMCAVFS